MNINIIAMGKIKESYYREACAEYIKRLGAYVKINVIEPRPETLSDSPSPAEIEKALKKEAEKIRAYIKSGSYTAALCIEGAEESSEKLSKRLEKLCGGGSSELNFLIGSSFGLSEELKCEADFKLSMSPMTFPHSLARVMLLEQIYRAFSIISNAKYHK